MTEQYFTGKDALKSYAAEEVTANERTIHKSKAFTMGQARTFVDFDTNISVRSDYNRRDYDFFRPSEREGRTHEQVVLQSQMAYKKVGLVKNTIDTMGDFGSQGIRLQHPDPKIQKFYEIWWEKVKGSERSERFLNLLYRHGTVIIKKSHAKIPVSTEKQWKKSVGKNEIPSQEPDNRKIPIKYNFLNPINVEAVGGQEALFLDQPPLVLKVNSSITNFVGGTSRIPNDYFGSYQKMVDKIPADLKKQLKGGQKVIPLDPETIELFFYKKDDWELWGTPLIDCILDDIIMLLKMKQSDVSALDAAISSVRLWTLGKLGNDAATTIIPKRAQINRVRDIIANNVGGGAIDLVWGPDLSFTESKSELWRWLGPDKYVSVLSAIYEGLGVPPSLRGGGSGGSTNTGNFVGLNTMIKRLEYGRNLLVNFWDKELEYIHKAMGFTGAAPEVIFDYMILADEAAEKQLLISLWDRDILPTESVLEIFKRLPPVEFARLKAEMEKRGKDMPEKASPYHNAEKAHDMAKLEKSGEISLKQAKLKNENTGRPANVIETKKRKKKPTAKPSTKAMDLGLMLWSVQAQDYIQENVTPCLIKAFDKSNARQLTEEEFNIVENIKFSLLSNLKPYIELNESNVGQALSNLKTYNKNIFTIAENLQKDLESKNGRKLKIDEIRQIHVAAYSIFHNNNDT